MPINEEYRQLEIIEHVEALTRTLAHSTRNVPLPRESYSMLGELGACIRHLAQVTEQLAGWHNRVEDGIHYEGEDGGGTGSARAAATELTTAVSALNLAANHVDRAYTCNGGVRWYIDLSHFPNPDKKEN